MHTPPLIVGAGLAGLSCAQHLSGDYLLIEQAGRPGGTARTDEVDGFHFDCTGHWLHLRDPHIERLIRDRLTGNLIEVQRRADIHTHGRRLPYPFQANTHGLPPEVVADCLLGFFAAREAALSGVQSAAENFEQHIRNRLGDGIAEHFMIPYNTKIWTVPPSELSAATGGRFVPIPSAREVVRGAVVPTDTAGGLGYNSSFFYPRTGGIQSLAQALADNLRRAPVYENRLVNVDLANRQATLVGRDAAPAQVDFGALVSTLPLPQLLDMLGEAVPAAVRQARAQLRATQVTYWNIGVRGATPANMPHWTYFPEAEFPFYRVGCASAAVPSLAPEGCRSHYAEVAHPQGTACSVTGEQVLAGLRRAGILNDVNGGGRSAPDEMLFCEQQTIDPAYVIMDHAYDQARQRCLQWLAEHRIHSIGRYGSWIYDSMEGAMIQGREVAAVLNGSTAAGPGTGEAPKSAESRPQGKL